MEEDILDIFKSSFDPSRWLVEVCETVEKLTIDMDPDKKARCYALVMEEVCGECYESWKPCGCVTK